MTRKKPPAYRSTTPISARPAGKQPALGAFVHAEEILESISDAFYAVDHEWRFTYVNKVAERWWGKQREDLIGKHYWTEFPQAVGSLPYDAHLQAARERRVIRLEAVSPIVGHWIDISIFPSNSGLAVYFRDISERKRAEARQEMLVSELNHRVKNVLATVQAIAAQSLAGPEVAEAARERFTSRLIALAQANELLVQKSWRGASLMAICLQIASPYGGVQSGRFVVDGAELLLKPGATTALALALHELATNAAKYGALSTPNGCVQLHWAEIMEGDARRFELKWREFGGPAVTPPRRLGFGSRLIQRGLSGEIRGRVQMEYLPDGLVCVVNAPFEEVVAEP